MADLCIMGRTVHLETNSTKLLECLRRELESYGGDRAVRPDFLWRLVSEPDATDFEASWPEAAGFSDAGLSLVNFGQRSFIAVDLEAREAVGFLEERFTEDELRLVRLFLTTLITLTAPALGPAAGSAAHVAPEREEPLFSCHPGDMKE